MDGAGAEPLRHGAPRSMRHESQMWGLSRCWSTRAYTMRLVGELRFSGLPKARGGRIDGQESYYRPTSTTRLLLDASGQKEADNNGLSVIGDQ